MDYYICLAGYKVKRYDNEITQIFGKDDIKFLLTDPISLEWFQNPVYFRGNLYEKTTIQKWFRKSDIDPLTGENIDGDSDLIPCNLIKYLLYAFEELEDCLIFHSPPNCLKFAQRIGEYLPIKSIQGKDVDIQDISILGYLDTNEYYTARGSIQKCLGVQKNTRFDIRDLSDTEKLENCHVMNCYPLNKIKEISTNGTIIENSINNYKLEEYILVSIATGKVLKPHELFLTKNGYLVDKEYVGTKINAIKSNDISNFLSEADPSKCESFKNIATQFIEKINQNYIETSYKPVWDNFYGFGIRSIKDNNNLAIRIRSAAVRYYETLEEFRTLVSNDPTLEIGLKKISDLVTDNIICQEEFRTGKNIIEDTREKLGIPFIQDPANNTYGKDLSMLDLSGKMFRYKNFKDYCFVGTNLKGALFMDCEFFCSSFVGANLKGAQFIYCTFNYLQEFNGGPFYKTKIDTNTIFAISLGIEAPEQYFVDLYKENNLEWNN